MSSQESKWQNKWPQNVDHDASKDSSAFSRMAGSGQGAQPNKHSAIDGTKVLRIDRIENFLSAIKKEKK